MCPVETEVLVKIERRNVLEGYLFLLAEPCQLSVEVEGSGAGGKAENGIGLLSQKSDVFLRNGAGYIFGS